MTEIVSLDSIDETAASAFEGMSSVKTSLSNSRVPIQSLLTSASSSSDATVPQPTWRKSKKDFR